MPAPATERTVSNRPPTSHAKLHILLVEDNVDTAYSLSQLLELEGYQVTVAASVAEALAHDGAIDLLITDVGLPDGSGLGILHRLRNPDAIPGIVLSGYGSSDDVRRSREAGFRYHLTKPVDFTDLVTAIEAVSDVARSASPAPTHG